MIMTTNTMTTTTIMTTTMMITIMAMKKATRKVGQERKLLAMHR
jgi:hypothetical protein